MTHLTSFLSFKHNKISIPNDSPRTALLSPLAFLPTASFFRTWRISNDANPSRHAELEPLIRTYVAAGTLGLVAVMLVQTTICSVASTILFIGSNDKTKDEFWTELARSSIDGLSTDELARRADLAASWQNWVFHRRPFVFRRQLRGGTAQVFVDRLCSS